MPMKPIRLSKFSQSSIQYWIESIRLLVTEKRKSLPRDQQKVDTYAIRELAKQAILGKYDVLELYLVWRAAERAEEEARRAANTAESAYNTALGEKNLGYSNRQPQTVEDEIEVEYETRLGLPSTELAMLAKLERDAIQALRLARNQDEVRRVYLYVATKVGIYNEVAMETVITKEEVDAVHHETDEEGEVIT